MHTREHTRPSTLRLPASGRHPLHSASTAPGASPQARSSNFHLLEKEPIIRPFPIPGTTTLCVASTPSRHSVLLPFTPDDSFLLLVFLLLVFLLLVFLLLVSFSRLLLTCSYSRVLTLDSCSLFPAVLELLSSSCFSSSCFSSSSSSSSSLRLLLFVFFSSSCSLLPIPAPHSFSNTSRVLGNLSSHQHHTRQLLDSLLCDSLKTLLSAPLSLHLSAHHHPVLVFSVFPPPLHSHLPSGAALFVGTLASIQWIKR